MKTVWKGSLNFGLVSINVELYSAVQHHAVGFTLLHEKCHTPITYQRWCAHCKKEVSWEKIEKGIQLSDGNYFIISKENLKKLKPEKTDSIAIVEFVDTRAIDPILYAEHYYIVPSKTPYNAFFLFIKALDELDRVAIGQFVLRDKEYVCVLRPYKGALLLTTLNYGYEIRALPLLKELKAPKISSKELQLAEELIKKLSKKTFNIDQFKDTFITKLKAHIRAAKKGKKPIKQQRVKKEISGTLTKVLEASLGKHKKVSRPEARA